MSLSDFKFQNTYLKLPKAFYQENHPTPVKSPSLIKWNDDLAQSLNIKISSADKNKPFFLELTEALSGNKVLNGSVPISTVYSGHQFGHFSPVLGDGRAHLLGELKGEDGLLYDIQLKGSGRSAFSRSGDGRSPLGPVVREYIVSEAMHYLGVATTRALAAVAIGDNIIREEVFKGGVLTRVATSFTRVGTFEYFASRGDKKNLKILLNYLVNRLYPEIKDSKDLPLDFFKSLAEKQTKLVAQWMSLGFIHGVMNTDNCSAAGLTIDYGPCAFLDETDFNKVFSFIDKEGRYSYKNQPNILRWNLTRLAETLIFLYDENIQEEKVVLFTQELEAFIKNYELHFKSLMFEKLGLSKKISKEKEDLLNLWLNYLSETKTDFTLGFRNLSLLIKEHKGALKEKEKEEDDDESFYKTSENFIKFKELWLKQINARFSDINEAVKFLNSKNPIYIPRNHMIEEAIKEAYQGEFSNMERMNKVLKNPFTFQKGFDDIKNPPSKQQEVRNTFCGT